jgi:DNA-binding CsgD family transcriptional regulator
VLGLLAAATTGTVVLIDDAHWLDVESRQALGFALSRLDYEPLLIVVALRSGDDTASLVRGSRVSNIALRGLDRAAAAALLTRAAEDAANPSPLPAIDQHVLTTCWQATSGNPLALLELARHLERGHLEGSLPLPPALPVGERLTSAFAARVRGLPDSTLNALALLAAADGAGPADATILAGAGLVPGDLPPAEAAGLITTDNGAIGFSHPLVRVGVRAAVGESVMRRAHRWLAAVTPDPARRTAHLVAAALGADEELAAALDVTARDAAHRGAPFAAAEAWEQAARFSTTVASRNLRLVEGAKSWWDCGETDRALAAAGDVLRTSADPAVRCAAVEVCGEAVGWTVDSSRGTQILRDGADDLLATDRGAAARLYLRAALHAGLSGDAEVGVALADAAVTSAGGDTALAVTCAAVWGMSAQRAGRGVDARAALESASLLFDVPVGSLGPALPAVQAMALAFMSRHQLEQAEVAARLALRAGRLHGLEGTLNFSSALLGEMLGRRGLVTEALVASTAYLAIDGAKQASTAPFAMAVAARIHASCGQLVEADRLARSALAAAQVTGMGTLEMWARAALGHAAVLERRWSAAVEHLEAVRRLGRAARDAGELWYQGDLGEAYLGEGRTADVLLLADEIESADPDPGRLTWNRAVATRLRASASSDRVALLVAAQLAGDLGAPVERARCLLLAGELRGRRGDLLAAQRLFEDCGANGWADRARESTHVARLGSDLGAVLSEAELRVALAVARGLTTREAADELFLSARTVDAHLRRIFAKLGVSNRTQLARRVARAERLGSARS